MFMNESRVPYLYGKVNDELVWIGYDDQQSFVEKVLNCFYRDECRCLCHLVVFVYLPFSTPEQDVLSSLGLSPG